MSCQHVHIGMERAWARTPPRGPWNPDVTNLNQVHICRQGAPMGCCVCWCPAKQWGSKGWTFKPTNLPPFFTKPMHYSDIKEEKSEPPHRNAEWSIQTQTAFRAACSPASNWNPGKVWNVWHHYTAAAMMSEEKNTTASGDKKSSLAGKDTLLRRRGGKLATLATVHLLK